MSGLTSRAQGCCAFRPRPPPTGRDRGYGREVIPRRPRPVAVAVAGLLLAGCTATATPAPGRAASSPAATPSGAAPAPAGPAPVFAFYYLWWDRGHWLSRLGPHYPAAAGATAAAAPLPAALDPRGCAATTSYPGNVETDISPGLGYDQSDPATIRRDVEQAAASGLSGFLVNWVGTGKPDQGPASSEYDQRLAHVFDAVHAVNAAGGHFRVVLNYQSSAKAIPVDQIITDLDWYTRTWGQDPALDHSWSPRPEVLLSGTWKYSDTDLAQVAQALRPKAYLIGDEKPSSWGAGRAAALDGVSYYWSSQDPYKNPTSFATLTRFAKDVRASRNPDGSAKAWLAPFTPGYNAALLYKTPTCVPRDDGKTMRVLYDGNSASSPDGWTLISWNEISEGSYVVPLERYGTRYVDVLAALLTGRR